MSRLAKVNLIPAPPPLVDAGRVFVAGGYLVVLLVLAYLTVGAYLQTQVLELDLQVTQARSDLSSRTVQRERQVAAAEAANDAKRQLADELNAVPIWSDLLPDLLARIPAGVSITSGIKLDRRAIAFSAVTRNYDDITAFRNALQGTRLAAVTIKGPDYDVTSRQFTFGVQIALAPAGGK